MKYTTKFNQKKESKKSYFIIGGTLIIIAIFLTTTLVIKNDNDEDVTNIDSPKTTSSAPTAQEDFTGGEERQEQGNNADKGTATVSDNQGEVSNVPNESEWTVSPTGQITLYSPVQNQLIQNGAIINGESSLTKVSFRVIDNISGVISTGELSVVNGKYSGNLLLTTTATEGRLDIYGTRSDGSEFSNIEVGVRFK